MIQALSTATDRRLGVLAVLLAIACCRGADAEDVLFLEGAVDVEVYAAPALAAPAEEQPVEGEDDDGLNAQAKALLQQYRPIYMSKLSGHLYALREVCNPTREQQEQLLESSQAALEKAVREYAKQMAAGKINRGIVVINGMAQMQGQSEPWDAVRNELDKAIAEHLTEDQLALYKQDARDRREFRRQAAATNLVSAIDKQLSLTEEQRDAVHASLLKSWQESWEVAVRGLLQSPQYLPQLPDKLIVPHLNANQKSVWKAAQRHGPVFFGDNGFMGHGGLQVQPFEPQDQRPEQDQPRGGNAARPQSTDGGAEA